VCVQFHIKIVHGIDSPFQIAYGKELTSPIKSEKKLILQLVVEEFQHKIFLELMGLEGVNLIYRPSTWPNQIRKQIFFKIKIWLFFDLEPLDETYIHIYLRNFK